LGFSTDARMDTARVVPKRYPRSRRYSSCIPAPRDDPSDSRAGPPISFGTTRGGIHSCVWSRIQETLARGGNRRCELDRRSRMHSHRAPDLPTGYIATSSPIYARVRCGWGGRGDGDGPAGRHRHRKGDCGGLVTSFGVGNAYFALAPRARWVDNIHCGIYRRRCSKRSEGTTSGSPEVRTPTSDTRPRRRGRLLLVPEVFSTYHTRSRFVPFARLRVRERLLGRQTARARSVLALIRHWVPLLSSLGWAPSSYSPSCPSRPTALGRSGVSLRHPGSQRERAGRSPATRPSLPDLHAVMILTLHVGYGIGAAAGLIDLVRSRWGGAHVGPRSRGHARQLTTVPRG